MNDVTFIADGKTRDFYFSFPYFLKSDIVVELDHQPATKYNLVRQSGGQNADVPFCGGHVRFDRAPKPGTSIRIYRRLPLQRIVDYQPTSPYNPAVHNMDMNYFLELLKDMQTALDRFAAQYVDIIDQDSHATIATQIQQISDAVVALQEQADQPDDPVDLSEINSSIANLATAINGLNARCDGLDQQIADLGTATPTLPENMDCVVDSQMPTAENNYAWYRKYASGWVEQGGVWTGSKTCDAGREVTFTIDLPVEMQDANYFAGAMVSNTYLMHMGQTTATTNVIFRFGAYITARTLSRFVWCVCGMGA